MRDFCNRPLMLRPEDAALLAVAAELDGTPQPLAALDVDGTTPVRRDVGWDLVEGVALIYVAGILVQRTGCLRPWGWGDWACTGYDGIAHNLATALADDQVRSIAFVIDSPGGECSGCFDLVDAIYGARGRKPLAAICAENACSAAYAIASATDAIAVPRTGMTGSIGVVTLHVDFSGMLENAGIKATLIQYGARKSDGAPVIPLSDAARARFQADIDTLGEMFVATVARNRGLDAGAVRDTQGATYLGELGVALGLADAVAAPEAALRAVIAAVAG
jgi:capsid assembly protease